MNERDARVLLGQNIQQQRERRGMSCAEFARRIGVSRPYVYDIEGGRAKEFPDLWRIAVALDVKVEELTEGISTERVA